ncbi:myo-inositol monophosphatase like 2 [Prunus dulcis]|uniref:Myo-inositol monophosphatase like 2 n=1 Tax=Prunus dulcis TaxID=3755 RepID=A0A4Y1RY57_PRUDU|nr:myo-inositol monophosphatase like 2 [Prunus dulcis]
MLSQVPKPLSFFQNPSPSIPIPNPTTPTLRFSTPKPSLSLLRLPLSPRRLTLAMASDPGRPDSTVPLQPKSFELDQFSEVANKVADASGEVIRKFFRQKFDILDKKDSSPVTIADQTAEETMVSILLENFPSHAVYGEENGWKCKEKAADYVWVLDPIDGTKSFITGKPVFGTLIALLQRGKPNSEMKIKNRVREGKKMGAIVTSALILGIIDQPILRERWVGMSGRKTTLNGQVVSTRNCANLAQAYLYTTSPHLFSPEAEEAFIRVRNKVKVPLYGCDCYAYALLASGFVDLVVESGLKPYDFLSLIPVIEGAGGVITDWKGHQLYWEASPNSHVTSKLFSKLMCHIALARFT